MAKKSEASGSVRARVLSDCALGRVNDVVEVDASQLESLAGVVDADPSAVAYAETLAQGAA